MFRNRSATYRFARGPSRLSVPALCAHAQSAHRGRAGLQAHAYLRHCHHPPCAAAGRQFPCRPFPARRTPAVLRRRTFRSRRLLQIAYGFDAPVVGAPDWLANTFYNIQARSDEAADARLAKITDNEVRLEKRNAIRVLLTDRLGVKTHLETRNSAIYNLMVAKGGVKMKAAPDASATRQWRGTAPAATRRRQGAWIAAWPRVRRNECADAGDHRRAEFDGGSARRRQDRPHSATTTTRFSLAATGLRTIPIAGLRSLRRCRSSWG